MNLSEKQSETLLNLLQVEHIAQAKRLRFINEAYFVIDDNLLYSSIGLLDDLSRIDEERARKIVVTVSAILWSYKSSSWNGLQDFLVLILTRVGFPPSAIMIDPNYDHSSGEFSSLGSLLNELSVTVNQIKHEIFIKDTKFLITGFQKKVWKKLQKIKLVGISAPTSAGKSFIILLKGVDSLLKERGNIIYIVPTLSLVAQVSSDFNHLLQKFNISDVRISTTYNSQEISHNKIYVLTQEKAISAFTQKDIPFKNVKLLVVDEIQNIERVSSEDDQRAKTLYDTLIEFRHTCEPDLTIISGPRIDGLKELGVDVFDQQSTDEVNTKDSPVASITYAISSSKGKYFFNQYTDLLDSPNKLLITNDSAINGYGGAQYRNKFMNYLSGFIKNLGSDSRNIIFSPTTAQARKTALKLAELSPYIVRDPKSDSLVNYIKETVHDEYDMCQAILKGFVYHHGKTPSHIRAVVERAIRDQLVSNVVCTTTLMQGVNLPAQNVILRNPFLSIRAKDGVKPKLTDYEIANLRGRAGRLLKDFIGRTFVLEENSFEHDNQLDLFPEAEKQIRSGYGEKYEEYKTEINKCLKENTLPGQEAKGYGFLITYIRQVLLKHGKSAPDRLLSVGIGLNSSIVEEVSSSLNNINIPKEICFKNRYWDPLDLDRLYQIRDSFDPPTNILEPQIEISLLKSIETIKSNFSNYYDKYFGLHDSLIRSSCISAKEWMLEKTLKEILSNSYFDNSDKIESKISLLQNKISYGLPMLLKPLYDIKAPDNMFLRFIEIGAYKPVTRKMIELNIPRETAIYLAQNYFNDIEKADNDIEQLIIDNLKQIKNSIDYWRRVQLEGVV